MMFIWPIYIGTVIQLKAMPPPHETIVPITGGGEKSCNTSIYKEILEFQDRMPFLSQKYFLSQES